MKLQKIGGYASIVNGLLTLLLLMILILIFPRLGLVEPSDWIDPVKGINACIKSPATFFLWDLDFILWGITLVLMALALRERMETESPNLMRLVVIGASISATLCLSYGLIGIVGFPPIVSAKDISAFRAMFGVTFGLSIAGDHASGWALLLSGCAALKTGKLSRLLAYLLILTGIVWILEFFSCGHSIYGPLVAVGLLVTFVSEVWLGIVLLQNRS